MRRFNINKNTVIDTMVNMYYTSKEIAWGLKKLYIVDVKTTGKYGTVIKGKRLFLLKRHATDFYHRCKSIDCEVEFYTMRSLGTDCYLED